MLPPSLVLGEIPYNDGKLLKLKIRLIQSKDCLIFRVMTSNNVITLEINGQSAGKESKSIMVGYGSPSTTERVLVNNDSLASLSLLKIQSSPL